MYHMSDSVNFFFFFFQAEDGIRGRDVTGVQTCALPIKKKKKKKKKKFSQKAKKINQEIPVCAVAWADPYA